MKMKDKIRSKDDEIREKNQVIKGLKRKLSAKNVKLCEKKSVVNNLTRKLYAKESNSIEKGSSSRKNGRKFIFIFGSSNFEGQTVWTRFAPRMMKSARKIRLSKV